MCRETNGKSLLVMHPLRRTLALLILVIYTVLGTVGVGSVICTGSNGHLAVEWAGANCCAESPAAAGERSTPEPESPCCPSKLPAPVPSTSETAKAHPSPCDDDGNEDCGPCEDIDVDRLLVSRNVDPEPNPLPPISLLAHLPPARFTIPTASDLDRRWAVRHPRPPPGRAPFASMTVLRF